MKMLQKGVCFVWALFVALLTTFSMPSLNHTPIGSRCGGCRYDGPRVGETNE
jgi:hypothetical protein